jgi:hypothetical protein
MVNVAKFSLLRLRNWRTSPAYVLLYLVFNIVIAHAQSQTGTSDVLFVQEIGALQILNKYQQKPSPDELKELPRDAPIVIVQARTTLGDSYTPCMKVKIEGDTYYLLTNSRGEPLNLDKALLRKWYRSKRIANELVEIVGKKKYFVLSFDRSKKYVFERNRDLTWIFSDGNDAYVRIPGIPSRYGWIALRFNQEGSLWRIKHPERPQQVDEQAIVFNRIVEKVEQTNKTTASLFAFFNRQTGRRKAAPRWIVSTDNGRLKCEFSSAFGTAPFQGSARMFADELRTILIGSEYRLQTTDGMMEISRQP